MKKKIFSVLLCTAIVALFTACSSDEASSSTETSSISSSDISSSSSESDIGPVAPEQSEEISKVSQKDTVMPGKHTLPCGMTLYFDDSVQNDVTGKWRKSGTSDSYVPADYAVEYYNEMFSSDDEIHAIWNAALGTTTSISVSGNLLFVDTHEYIDGEENDAKIMFSGRLLDSRIIDKETGEPFSGETSETPEIEDIQTLEPVTEPEPEQQPTEPEPSSSSEPEPSVPVLEPSSESAAAPVQSIQSKPIFTITGEIKEPDYPKTIEQMKASSSSNTSTSSGSTSRSSSSPAMSSNISSGRGNANNFNTYNNAEQQKTDADYVLNTNPDRMKFHYPTCSDVKKIAPENYLEFYGTRDEAIKNGYSPCGHCKP